MPRLGTGDGAMIVVSLVIGVGIFRTPAMVAAATGSSALFLAAWGVGALVSAAGALALAGLAIFAAGFPLHLLMRRRPAAPAASVD